MNDSYVYEWIHLNTNEPFMLEKEEDFERMILRKTETDTSKILSKNLVLKMLQFPFFMMDWMTRLL